ncbi:MAG: SpoIIAA family protein [Burkholderiales bacterium]|nr:STAS/SEC14 domain-containing protein [Sulfuricellaceae bacterium]
MITIEHKGDLVIAAVFGEFTLTDFKEFEEAILYKFKFHGKPALLLDLHDMADFTLDVVWEDIKFGREHGNDFAKIAVVSDSRWVDWAAWLSKTFLDSEIQVFEDINLAEDWVAPAR